MIIMMPRTRIL